MLYIIYVWIKKKAIPILLLVRGQKFHSSACNYERNLERMSNSSQKTSACVCRKSENWSHSSCRTSAILKFFCPLIPDNPLWGHLQWIGDNCIHNFHLGKYIVGYTDGNLVLRWWMITHQQSCKAWFPNVFLMIYLPKWKLWIWSSTLSNAQRPLV